MCMFAEHFDFFLGIMPLLNFEPSLMHGIDIYYVQHFQAMLECGVCELARSFFHFITKMRQQRNLISIH